MSDRLSFIRSDLSQLAAYKPHPGGNPTHPVDRLDTNESPLDLPLELKEKLTYLYQHTLEANRYPDGSHYKLQEAIAEYVVESAQVSWDVTRDRISVGNGSDELIRSLLIATCVGGEGSILVATPTFSMYGILATTLGIRVTTIGRTENNFAINLTQAKAAISNRQQPPVKVVFVVHPNSPTGNCLTPEELNWLRNLPQDILVVVDEAYFEYSQTSVAEEIAQHPNWVILRTFSKAFRLAAHRVGYAIANTDLIQVLEKVRLPYNLPAFSQTAALVALQNRHLLLPLVEETIKERAKMWQALTTDFADKLQVWETRANFFYLRLKNQEHQNEALADLTAKLKTQGTLIRHTGGGLRITVGTKEENQRTLQRLAN
ncbi:Histidinol-phosphate aminotransferase [Hyella patelloides LEGE 07179]|uniref:Histidinol-phosphate aminotransferase n=1 Tax=Hyella patelloides LEGE 07179 TaxID=945734 RepID=A0A563VXR1_9CYAN|nr:histidinol-phosphate transaminase [Hyella patelloides]VEP16177.1 Histidinol-phosphate aminotransferase [Hyella patelloides LEGE 07179]